MGYYKLHNMGTPLKKFMKKDILTLIQLKEFELALNLLNYIMDIFIDEVYWGDYVWYDIAYYYREYACYLIENGEFSSDEKAHVQNHVRIINDIVF